MHRITNVDPESKTADCEECGPGARVKFRNHRNHWACLVSERRRSAESRQRSSRPRRWRDVPGMNLELFERMNAEQGGVCRICRRVDPRTLVADHDHATGRIRGLLCHRCNRALGFFRDDPELLLRAALHVTPTDS